jgi:hypothetical protein
MTVTLYVSVWSERRYKIKRERLDVRHVSAVNCALIVVRASRKTQ